MLCTWISSLGDHLSNMPPIKNRLPKYASSPINSQHKNLFFVVSIAADRFDNILGTSIVCRPNFYLCFFFLFIWSWMVFCSDAKRSRNYLWVCFCSEQTPRTLESICIRSILLSKVRGRRPDGIKPFIFVIVESDRDFQSVRETKESCISSPLYFRLFSPFISSVLSEYNRQKCFQTLPQTRSKIYTDFKFFCGICSGLFINILTFHSFVAIFCVFLLQEACSNRVQWKKVAIYDEISFYCWSDFYFLIFFVCHFVLLRGLAKNVFQFF